MELPKINSPQLPPVAQDHLLLGQSKNPWQRFANWVSRHKKLSIFLGVLAVLGLAGGGAAIYFALRPPQTAAPAPAVAKQEPAPVKKFYSPLTGIEVPDEATTKRQVTGIMIENSPDARPQSGLKAAGVVFEAVAEGGITRFSALYQEARPGLIGPVRSLRPYYLDWMTAFDASISHVGGSFFALQEIRRGGYKDIDQFFNGGSYWRASDRYAPHNVYTSFDRLDALNQAKGFTSSNFNGFAHKPGAPAATPQANKVDIAISSATYNVHYGYDKASNTYLRYLGGVPHTDREAGHITPSVVIAIRVPVKLGFEDGWREQMTTLGSGQAFIFQDGTVTQGTWHKGSRREQIQFKDSTGKVVPLNQGQVWITATAPEKAVTWQ